MYIASLCGRESKEPCDIIINYTTFHFCPSALLPRNSRWNNVMMIKMMPKVHCSSRICLLSLHEWQIASLGPSREKKAAGLCLWIRACLPAYRTCQTFIPLGQHRISPYKLGIVGAKRRRREKTINFDCPMNYPFLSFEQSLFRLLRPFLSFRLRKERKCWEQGRKGNRVGIMTWSEHSLGEPRTSWFSRLSGRYFLYFLFTWDRLHKLPHPSYLSSLMKTLERSRERDYPDYLGAFGALILSSFACLFRVQVYRSSQRHWLKS